MRNVKNLGQLKLLSIASAIVLLVGGIVFSFSCTPKNQKVSTEVDLVRQKAIHDSVRKAYEYELSKTWSTAYEHYKNKNYRRAINPFWKIIEMDTIDRFKEKFTYLYDSYVKLNNPDSAQIVLEAGVKEYPNHAHLHRTLAYFLDARGLTKEAIQEYEKAIAIDSTKVTDWKALGNLYIKNNQLEDATKAFEKVIKLDPKDQDSQRALSRLYKSSGDTGAAIQRMEEVKKLNPNNTENLFNLGKEYFNNGDYDNAVVNLEQLLKLKPDDATAMEYFGNALQNRSDYRRAINVYNEAMKLQPTNKKILCDIATCYSELGQYQTARNNARQALEIDPKYGLARIVIGEIYEVQAQKCYAARGKKLPEFDDKLIYDLAYQEYVKATQDLQFKDLAERKMSYINDFRPSKEDLFFHRGQTKPKDPCYDWIYK